MTTANSGELSHHDDFVKETQEKVVKIILNTEVVANNKRTKKRKVALIKANQYSHYPIQEARDKLFGGKKKAN